MGAQLVVEQDLLFAGLGGGAASIRFKCFLVLGVERRLNGTQVDGRIGSNAPWAQSKKGHSSELKLKTESAGCAVGEMSR